MQLDRGRLYKCPMCAKAFWVTSPTDWVYVVGQRKVCSWTCLRRAEKTGYTGRPKQHQVHNPKDYRPPERWFMMRQMRLDGVPLREVAAAFGVRETSVYSMISKLNKWERTKT